MGHIGDRGDDGHWNSFEFEVLSFDGEIETVTLNDEDLGDDIDWDRLFDYLDDIADEYDVDYENGYGESE